MVFAMLLSFIPALFAFLAVAVMMFYKLDNTKMEQIEAELTERKAAVKTTVPSSA
jgi:glycoside/pentoside/hexuronide:cation symporter, GPH family